MTLAKLTLADGMALAGMNFPDLWISYFALSGNDSAAGVREHIETCGCPDSHEHNVIAQSINEALADQDQDETVAYRDLPATDNPISGHDL